MRSSVVVASPCRRCSRSGPPSRCAWRGILDLPPEVLSLLRYGRALDNSPFKRTGFHYQYSTAGTVDAFARGIRLENAVGSNRPAYQYERDVETFFRHSPAVVREKT